MSKKHRPFSDPNNAFISEITENIISAAEWFCNSTEKTFDGTNEVFGAGRSSYWEAALSAHFLLKSEQYLILDPNSPRCTEINILQQKIRSTESDTFSWLIRSATHPNITEEIETNSKKNGYDENTLTQSYYNWDNNLWDTAMILHYIISFVLRHPIPTTISPKYVQKIVSGALSWIRYIIYLKHREHAKTTLSATDLAPVLAMIIDILKNPNVEVLLLGDKDTRNKLGLTSRHLRSLMHSIALRIANDMEKSSAGDKMVWSWNKYMATADGGEALAFYLAYLWDYSLYRKNSQLCCKIYNILLSSCNCLERKQKNNGTWGTHDDTVRCLNAYLIIGSVLKNIDQQITVPTGRRKLMARYISKKELEPTHPFHLQHDRVFKAIRWIFDEKHYCFDGSYLHSSYMTVFFSHALLTLAEFTAFTKERKTIYTIYDEVISLSTIESGADLIESIELKTANEHCKKDYLNAVFLNQILTAFAAAITILSSIIFLFHLTSNSVNEYIPMVFAVIVAVFAFTYTYIKSHEIIGIILRILD
ncbi:hypothetical protein [Methanorbis furvi]|uniref:Uncharacterized protein n=1 Tax=Methanorbis furvi TaxID=3028299 RepID=A0AAE4MBH0_9EURY|nr:hypothetical protein [Methanocorpusculaceae archaeon Ag1]